MPVEPAPPAGTADPIAELLAGTYVDRDTGDRLGTTVRAVEIGEALEGREADWVEALAIGGRFALLADVDTYRVLGERVERVLRGRFGVHAIVLPARPRPDRDTVDRIVRELDIDDRMRPDAILAVGSGTLNDLAKMAASQLGVASAVFATAPSMNGYTSVSASIIDHGLKRSYRTAAPVGVFMDLDVLAAAPKRMIRAGIGDSACRSTAQVDWLLSHLLLATPYRDAPFALLAADERALFAPAAAAAVVAGDRAAMRALARTLVLSGFGMTIANGSFPASQGEHMLAHYVELVAPDVAHTRLHGEHTGVTALIMAGLQRELLERDPPPELAPTAITEADVLAHFGPVAGPMCWAELAPKLLDRARAEQLTAQIGRDWDAIRARLAAVHVDREQLHAALAAAGARTLPHELGWSSQLVDDALRFARATRNRFGALDIVGDLQLPGRAI